MRTARTQYSPLTPEERQFAEVNHYLVEQFLHWNHLQWDDWYDVVIFRYLLSIKKWMQRPELHKYKFATIVNNALKGAVSNERVKQSRRIQTVSLEESVPGTDEGITYKDVVTVNNLDYINYGEYEDSKKKNRKTKYDDLRILKLFLEAEGYRELKLTYGTRDEASKRSVSLYRYRNFHGLREKIRISREDKIIYVVKIEGGK